MSKIIKLPHLQEVILDLVDKIKLRFNQTVVAVDFNENTNIVTVSKGDGQTTTEFSLNKFVDEWGDLDCVTEYPYANLFDYTERVDNKKYLPDGSTATDTGTSSVIIEVLGGNQYSIFRQHNDNHDIVFYDAADRFVDADTTHAPAGGGWHKKVVNVPANATKMAVNFRKNGSNSHLMMVIKGDVINEVTTHIPYLDGGRILIGDCVTLSFDNNGTTLASTTHESAIKELDNKVTTLAGGTVTSVNGERPDNQGNVQIEIINIPTLQDVLNGKVNAADLTKLGGVQHAEKIPQLDDQGKLHLSMLPDISINKVHSVTNQQEAETLIQDGTAAVGDIFIVEDEGNAVYMYVNDQGADFTDKCVELTMANGTVKKVNGITADPTGNVTVTANDITLANGQSTVEIELGKKLETINNQPAINGNIDLGVSTTNTDIELKVGNHVYGSVPYITTQQVNDIIDLFV